MSTRRTLLTLVTALLAVLAIGVAATPAQAAGFSPMKIWHSTHCLDNATQDATRLQMWSCSGATEQTWLDSRNSQTGRYTFTNQRTGRCITAPLFNAGIVTMQFCDASAGNQQWRLFAVDNPTGQPFDYYFVWQSVSSNFCLTTPSVANGTRVQTTTCDPSDQYDRWNRSSV
jgi:hypothetical protein